VSSLFSQSYAIMLAAAVLSSCHRHTEGRVSSFSVVDPTVSKQLISGFYASENGFRWAGLLQYIQASMPKSRRK
jgi:hypothetical protein